MFRMILACAAFCLTTSIVVGAGTSTENYLRWLRFVDTQRVHLAQSALSQHGGTAEQRRAFAAKFARAVKLFNTGYKRTKPPVPPSCAELDRLYEAARNLEPGNADAAVPYGLDPAAYGRDAKVMAGIREEQKDLEGALREEENVAPQEKMKIFTNPIVPLPDGK